MIGVRELLTNILFAATIGPLIFCVLCLLMLADDLIVGLGAATGWLIWLSIYALMCATGVLLSRRPKLP